MTKMTKTILKNFIIVFILLVSVGCNKGNESKVDTKMTAENIMGGETAPILSSAFFSGKAAKAYQIAKEIPQILDGIYCYCDCKIHHGHKSLLTCYTSTHGAKCGICIDEAIKSMELYKQNKSVLEIRQIIDKMYAKKR